MKSTLSAPRAALVAVALSLWLPVMAQNVAIVNGKPVPKSRVDTLLQQATRGGQQPITPELEARAREEVVLREIFVQEAERRGLTQSAAYKSQMELARQTILIRELFGDWQKNNPVTESEARAEYDKFKAQASGSEYRARHILVESEDEAKRLTAQIKGGASFEDLAKKHSKDPGSASSGGDLDYAKPDAYVAEFGQALAQLKKGEVTEAPVRTQFGWHIIKLEDTRDAQFPAFDEVRPQIEQQLAQVKMQQYQQSLRDKAKTDFKFSQ